jgi:selenocysteine lyase/cysteine desulfurase
LPVSAVNWTSVQGARDFNNLTNLTIDYRPGALRWDAPETASFFNCMPMAASLELLGSIGADGILRHASGLIDILVAGLPAGFRAASRLDAAHRSSIVRLVTDDPVVTRTAYQRCKDAGLSLSMREDGLRVSPGIWNDAADIERLLEALS